MKIDICLKHEEAELPELPIGEHRYVLASNGAYLERRTPMFTTSARVKGDVPGLAEHYQYCLLACGKINRAMHGAMLAFFAHAHRLHGGEAALILLYDVDRRRFRWFCPEQTVEMYQSGGRWWACDTIRFEHPLDLPDGYVLFGDAHLHPGSPYPSAVDAGDDQDGLHIIVGRVGAQTRYHVDFVMDGVRFAVRESLIFEDPECQPWSHAPEGWLQRIRLVAYPPHNTWTADAKTAKDHDRYHA